MIQSTQETRQIPKKEAGKAVRISDNASVKLKDLAALMEMNQKEYLDRLIDENYTRYANQIALFERARKGVRK